MNKLQKKCFIAAVGLHLLLVIILFVGPGFLSSNSKDKMLDAPVLTFIPYKTTDQDISGGGDPKGGAPAPAPVPPKSAPVAVTPKPEPQPIAPAPKPQPKEVTPPKETAIPRDPPVKPKRSKPDISTEVVRRNPNEANTAAKVAADARTAAQARQRAIDQMANAIDQIGDKLSSGTSVKLKGPGGGGLPYANFLQGVKKIYSDAWLVPEGIKDDSATVTVSVTIARDGTVVSSKIVQRSSDAAVNNSVQMTLDRVSRVVPLPDDSKENTRTVTINFNVKSKLLG